MSPLKCFAIAIFLAGCIDLVFNSIASTDGYTFVRIEWANYTNLTLEEAKKGLSLEMPGVEFAVYTEDIYFVYSEEFYLNRIRLVINGTDNPVVVLPPVYVGYEPDVKLVQGALGMTRDAAIKLTQEKIPDTKIVSPPNVTIEGNGNYPGYILLETDDNGTVVSPPKLVRESRRGIQIF